MSHSKKEQSALYKVYHTTRLYKEYCKTLVYARVKDGSHKSPIPVDLLSCIDLRGVHTVTQKGLCTVVCNPLQSILAIAYNKDDRGPLCFLLDVFIDSSQLPTANPPNDNVTNAA